MSQVRHHSGCIPHGGGSPGRAAPDVPVGQHDQEDQWRRKCHFNHQGRQNEETTDRPQGSERERLRLRPTGESSEEGIHHDGSTGLRDRGITPPRQGSHRSLQDDQVEYREEAGGTNQLGKDSTGGEITPRQIHQRIRGLPTEALCKQTPAVLQLPEVWTPGQDLQVRGPDLQVLRRKTRVGPVQGQRESYTEVRKLWTGACRHQSPLPKDAGS